MRTKMLDHMSFDVEKLDIEQLKDFLSDFVSMASKYGAVISGDYTRYLPTPEGMRLIKLKVTDGVLDKDGLSQIDYFVPDEEDED